MLVLSRKAGESIVVGHDIVITVVRIAGNVVRVGVQAPENVNIARLELTDEASKPKPAASPPSTHIGKPR